MFHLDLYLFLFRIWIWPERRFGNLRNSGSGAFHAASASIQYHGTVMGIFLMCLLVLRILIFWSGPRLQILLYSSLTFKTPTKVFLLITF
jgi:hypothetical protein